MKSKFKKGLVFGKFMPVHHGHLALIDFALMNCNELIVSMSYTPTDPIEPEQRFGWLNEIFKGRKNIRLVKYLDDFNDENLPLFDATKLWAAFIKQEFPDIEAFFCSEAYGEPLSYHLGLPMIIFDQKREIIPISASKIRQNPFQNWAFIPEVVKPYFTKKICLFGSESVGKSTLTKRLAEYFDTSFSHEVVRDLITSNDEINESKIIEIGLKQTELIENQAKKANKILFCDTDILTTQIYSKHYLGEVSSILFELEKRINFDLYFLLNIDTKWVDDPLRDLGNKRKEMFEIFKSELEKRQIQYVLINGDWEERFDKMKVVIEERFLG